MNSVKNFIKSKSRTDILTMLIMGAFVVIVVRLFFLQIIDGQKYKAIGDENHHRKYVISPTRGVIYAMDGKTPTKLVMNEYIYSLYIDPAIIEDQYRDEIIAEVKKIAGGNMIDGFESFFDEKNSRYMVIARGLNRTQAKAIEKLSDENSKKFGGLGLTEGIRRVYPEGNLAAQVLGFVNNNGGNYGVEAAFEKELAGKAGQLKYTTDVMGARLGVRDEDVNIPKEDGKNIVLSIDRNIQAKTEAALKSGMEAKGIKNGAVLVMDPQSGRVLAMANYPTYNPDKYFEVEDSALFNNNTTTMQYENGSVIKSFTMAMGLNEGVANGSGTFYNVDSVQVYDRTINNAVLGYTGMVDFQTAMNYSMNTGMVEISSRLGGGTAGNINKSAMDKMYGYYKNNFFFGRETGIELPESEGVVISPDEEEGNAVRYSNMSFGQGMENTMIQTATAFSSIINGGTRYKPTIIAGEVDKNGKFIEKGVEVEKEGVISKESSDEMREILKGVRVSNGVKDDLEGFQIGGKTGTSETLVNGRYVKDQTIGTYLGFGGNNSPKFVIMVTVWGEGQALGGYYDAIPIFTDISNWMLEYMKINPKGN